MTLTFMVSRERRVKETREKTAVYLLSRPRAPGGMRGGAYHSAAFMGMGGRREPLGSDCPPFVLLSARSFV